MRISAEELARRLATAAQIPAKLRKSTIALRELGEGVIEERRRGPQRTNQSGGARGWSPRARGPRSCPVRRSPGRRVREPRETRDVYLALIELTLAEAAGALKSAGIETRSAFEELQFGGLLLGRLTLRGSGGLTGLNTIHLARSRSARCAAKAVSRAVEGPLMSRIVRLLSVEDFVLFKAPSTRRRDIEDAASALRRSHDLIDAELIKAEPSLLASELPDFDVVACYEHPWEVARSQPG